MTARRSGFSLVELLITLTVLAMVTAALMIVLAGSMRSKMATEGVVEAQQAARVTVELIARDIRSAGYAVDKDATPPQPAFAYVDSMELILYANLQPVASRTSAVPSATNPPHAPEPTGSPLPPRVLSGSAYPAGYAIPMKWSTGAEMVRYTLDINSDGVVDAADQLDGMARDAHRSLNPNDFVLARMVYGDYSGSVPTAGNNGGTVEKVGLVRGAGSGVPHLFTVYLGSNPAPWDWSMGAVPADRLDEISRVVLNVTAESRSPDKAGNYARATISTEVSSIRNVPEAATTNYTVDGYVYNDLDKNHAKDAGEPGIPGVALRLGTAAVGQTNATGYFILAAVPGSYTLYQEVPAGFGAFDPDSALVLLATNVQHSFADTAIPGGWIRDTCWVDEDGDGLRDPGEPHQDGVTITVGSASRTTNFLGYAEFFVTPGSYSVSATAPESMYVTTTNPLNVVVADGDTVSADFGLEYTGTGTVSGKVYKDVNKDGDWDAGETGIPGVWVAVTKNLGADVLGFANTDANGDYTVAAPSNDPAHVTPYELTYQVPPGYYAMGSTMYAPIWLDTGETMTGMNFGVQNFQVITLTADRVLSLGSGELMEKDWSGGDTQYDSRSHKDQDLILGSEWVSNPNVSVWFNQWDTSPLFAATPTYQRNANSSALALAVGTIDNGSPETRPDVVCGLQTYASGNIAVWITQNTSGNFGYLPTNATYYKTQDNGDVNAVLLSLCDAGPSLDLIAGTKSYAGAGTIEVWTNNGAGVFTRDEIYPPNGGLTPGSLGEVRAMALGDFDADADSDLVVVTRTFDNSGRMHIFEKVTDIAGARFIERRALDLTGEGSAVAVLDVNGDARRDIVAGTKTNDNSGKLEYWRNNGSFDFNQERQVSAPGVVLSLAVGDFGGIPRHDLAMGYRDNMTAYTGGVRIYYTDLGTLPSSSADPAAGSSSYMTPAANANHFNFGANPAPVGARLPDLAVAQKPTATTGQVVIFVR